MACRPVGAAGLRAVTLHPPSSVLRSLGTTSGTTPPFAAPDRQPPKCRKPASKAGFRLVGAARFELATFRPPAERATKLRHAPGTASLRELSSAGSSGRPVSNRLLELGRLACNR